MPGVGLNLAADPDVRALFQRFFNRGNNEPLSAEDRSAVVNVLVVKGNISQADAQRTVERWDAMYLEARNKMAEIRVKAEEKARRAGEQAASVVAKTAAWTAVIMALGALAGAFGGYESVPKDIRGTPLHRKRRIGQPAVART